MVDHQVVLIGHGSCKVHSVVAIISFILHEFRPGNGNRDYLPETAVLAQQLLPAADLPVCSKAPVPVCFSSSVNTDSGLNLLSISLSAVSASTRLNCTFQFAFRKLMKMIINDGINLDDIVTAYFSLHLYTHDVLPDSVSITQ